MTALPLHPGQLRDRVMFRRPVETATGKGGYTTTFEDVDSQETPAEVTGLDGRESVMGQVLEGVSVYRIRIRPRSDVKADWQIRFGALDLNIKAPPSNPGGRWPQLIIIADTASTLPT